MVNVKLIHLALLMSFQEYTQIIIIKTPLQLEAQNKYYD